jgi:hexosaminidase
MMDIGRNAHSIECLHETIDLLWYYKVDSLHLHLTDDQRFAFPSKAFPKLTTQRGSIAWDEFADLEAQARLLGVYIIPELDVPGHSTILRREYPDIFGKSPSDLAQSAKSIKGLKTLLTEMIELFPSSPYIHIGGDEAYGVPDDTQRSLINDLNAFLKTKNKTTLVWEGPPQGKGASRVDPEVIHINWRTINYPADKMVDAGHPVVNAAWDPLYIVDHYPRNNFTMASPERIYSRMKLERFAHFNPDIPTFSRPVMVPPTKRLIGFCMPWWEGREENFFSMIEPRIAAFAEVAWDPGRERNYDAFAQRVATTEAFRQRLFHPVRITAEPVRLEREGVFDDRTNIRFQSDTAGTIRYTVDGSLPTVAANVSSGELTLDKSTQLRAALFQDGKKIGFDTRRKFTKVTPEENLALGKPVKTNVSSGPVFSVDRLTDGGTGNLDYFVGYPAKPNPIELTIDLEATYPVNRVVVHAFHNGRAWESYRVQVSRDGSRFETVADRSKKPTEFLPKVVHDFDSRDARYVRILTKGCQDNVFSAFSRKSKSSRPRWNRQRQPTG